MADCIFCQIAAKEMAADLVYEDEQLVAFPDINPQAPVHLLIIPKRHMESLAETQVEHGELLASMLLTAKDLARKYDLTEGYRVVANIGEAGGQTVPHLHFHLLGGRDLGWPPG